MPELCQIRGKMNFSAIFLCRRKAIKTAFGAINSDLFLDSSPGRAL